MGPSSDFKLIPKWFLEIGWSTSAQLIFSLPPGWSRGSTFFLHLLSIVNLLACLASLTSTYATSTSSRWESTRIGVLSKFSSLRSKWRVRQVCSNQWRLVQVWNLYFNGFNLLVLLQTLNFQTGGHHVLVRTEDHLRLLPPHLHRLQSDLFRGQGGGREEVAAHRRLLHHLPSCRPPPRQGPCHPLHCSSGPWNDHQQQNCNNLEAFCAKGLLGVTWPRVLLV